MELYKDINQLNQLILDNMSEGILLVEVGGKVTAFNPAASKILRIESNDLSVLTRSKLLDSFFNEKMEPLSLDEFPTVIVEKTLSPIFTKTVLMKTSLNEFIHLKMTAIPLFSEQPNKSKIHTQTLLTLVDLTEMKKMEKEIKDKEALLIHSAKLTSLGEMSAGIAHEINNPLAIILGRIDIFKQNLNSIYKDSTLEFLKSEISKLLELLETHGFRIERIIKSMTYLARRNDFSQKIFESFNSSLEEIQNICYENFKKNRIDFRVKLEPDILVENYQGQIAQVVLNLLNNSRDAVRSLDERWIELAAFHRDHFLYITVTDSGHGITKTIQDKMMAPFFTTKAPGEGTGLGLSISRRIIDTHHGELYLDNDCKNTRFVIKLPKSVGH